MAAEHWYGSGVILEYRPAPTFSAVFHSLEKGDADEAVVAIENSLFGSISEVYDLLSRHHYPVVGELSERIHQQLIGFPKTPLTSIKTIYSHPVALAQCSSFLDRRMPWAERREYHDTAAAVGFVKKNADPTIVAVAGSAAAAYHELAILSSNIENDHQNYTRFLIISPDRGKAPIEHADKASLVLRTTHEVGALYRALGVFAEAGINLSKLESRPIVGSIWNYRFYIDVEIAGADLDTAIKKLTAQGCQVTLLGTYKAALTQFED